MGRVGAVLVGPTVYSQDKVVCPSWMLSVIQWYWIWVSLQFGKLAIAPDCIDCSTLVLVGPVERRVPVEVQFRSEIADRG